jgi:hypothetical protein
MLLAQTRQRCIELRVLESPVKATTAIDVHTLRQQNRLETQGFRCDWKIARGATHDGNEARIHWSYHAQKSDGHAGTPLRCSTGCVYKEISARVDH